MPPGYVAIRIHTSICLLGIATSKKERKGVRLYDSVFSQSHLVVRKKTHSQHSVEVSQKKERAIYSLAYKSEAPVPYV